MTVLGQAHEVLPREDLDAAAVVRRSKERDGVRLELGVRLDRVDGRDGELAIHYTRERPGHIEGSAVAGDVLLVAAGRAPNIENLEIGEVVYAMTYNGTVAALSTTVHPHPTQAEGLRKAGDAYRRQSLTPGVRRWLERYFSGHDENAPLRHSASLVQPAVCEDEEVTAASMSWPVQQPVCEEEK